MRKWLEVIAVAAIAFQVWLTYSALAGPNPLPSQIPTHFDAAGNPNGWGSPSILLFLNVITIGLYLLITVVAMFPAGFNFPVRVTEENRLRLQNTALNMIVWVKTELVCLFTVLLWSMIQAVRSGEGRLPPLLMPAFIVLIFGTVAWHLVAMIRAAVPTAE